MSTTLGELKTRVSTVLQDPEQRTFTDELVEELIKSALIEVGRIAPEQFVEDLVPVENQLSYVLRYAPADIEVTGEASDDIFDSEGHGLTNGTRIKFTALVGGTGLSLNTTYYVRSTSLTADTFRLATSMGTSTLVTFTTNLTEGSTFRRVAAEDAITEIEVMRVEVWDATQSPDRLIYAINPASAEPGRADSGWYTWAGSLVLPSRVVSSLVGYESQYVIRVWGYSPYLIPYAEEEVISISRDVEQAIVWYIRVEAIDMLLASRDLFTQWQTRSGNTDVSPASLMNQRSIAEQMWTRKSRSLARLRSEV